MKKVIVIVLVALMVVSLAACGNSEELEKYRKYETLINYLEAEEYANAIKEIVALRQAGGKQTENEEEKEATAVDITIENWQDYFEFKTRVSEKRNDFDEFEEFYPAKVICLKDEWKEKVVDMDVAVEYSFTGGYSCYYTYNIETGELTEGERTTDYATEEDSGTFTMDKYNIDNPYVPDSLRGWITSGSCKLEGNIATVIGSNFENIEITRKQGTISVVE
jgi:hypothetical protein